MISNEIKNKGFLRVKERERERDKFFSNFLLKFIAFCGVLLGKCCWVCCCEIKNTQKIKNIFNKS